LILRCGVQPQNVGRITLSQLEAVFGLNTSNIVTFKDAKELSAFYSSL